MSTPHKIKCKVECKSCDYRKTYWTHRYPHNCIFRHSFTTFRTIDATHSTSEEFIEPVEYVLKPCRWLSK